MVVTVMGGDGLSVVGPLLLSPRVVADTVSARCAVGSSTIRKFPKIATTWQYGSTACTFRPMSCGLRLSFFFSLELLFPPTWNGDGSF